MPAGFDEKEKWSGEKRCIRILCGSVVSDANKRGLCRKCALKETTRKMQSSMRKGVKVKCLDCGLESTFKGKFFDATCPKGHIHLTWLDRPVPVDDAYGDEED
jgi:hypothetical protein